jgi:glycosyltransferase involved in cell wall biosynthesis
LIPLVVKNHYSILIFDIFPDALVDSGFLSKQNLLVKWWKKANLRVYDAAERVFTISESMREVLQNYSSDKNIELVPIWADNRFLKRIEPSDNPFIKRHDLQGKFIVMYSGNIGLSGQVEVMVEIAASFTRNDIVFVIIGDGAKLKWLKQNALESSLKNVLILPWQPAKELSYSLSSANLAVVGIDRKASRLAMPSKLLSYLSVGAPILCLASEDTELAKFVKENNVGKAFDSSQKIQISKYIEWLMDNPDECEQISRNSSIASQRFNYTNAKKFL